jgi:hypothetical protein
VDLWPPVGGCLLADLVAIDHDYYRAAGEANATTAVESINQPKVHMQARRLLGAGISIPADRVSDPDLDLAAEIAAHESLLAQ